MLTCALTRNTRLRPWEQPPAEEISRVREYLERMQARKFAVDPLDPSVVLFDAHESMALSAKTGPAPEGYSMGIDDPGYMPLAYDGMDESTRLHAVWFHSLPTTTQSLWGAPRTPRDRLILCAGFASHHRASERSIRRAQRILTGEYPNRETPLFVYPVADGYGTGTDEEAEYFKTMKKYRVYELPALALWIDDRHVTSLVPKHAGRYRDLLDRLFEPPAHAKRAVDAHGGAWFADGRPTYIDRFEGSYAWLSNYAPCDVTFEGLRYPSVENAYQAAKTQLPELRRQFTTCSPDEAKRLGRKLIIRTDWDDARISVMRALLREKFSKEPFHELLMATGEATLIEGNWWGDTFWGISGDKGRNQLGTLLMELRDELAKSTRS